MKEPKKDHEKESNDNYADTLARVGNSHRVILVRSPSQYVLQKSNSKGWYGISYHTQVTSLRRVLNEKGLDASCTDTMVPVRELNL